MTTWRACIILAALVAAVPAGCQRAGNTPAKPPVPAAAAPATATAPAMPDQPERTDYRTLHKSDLENLIRTKIGVETVTLIQRAPNRYSGQISAPDGTLLPLEVTVDAERIDCDTITAAGSTRQTITPNAPVQSGLTIR